VKESLTSHFLFGPVIRARKPIVVKRTDPREDLRAVMEQGKKLLEEGTSVIIFPQSTRDTAFDPAAFNTLGIKLAKSAGVDIIPVAIKTDFWENGKWLKDLGPVSREKTIHMQFAAPMKISGSGKEEHQRIVEFISTYMNEWGGKISSNI